jgi:hypothetical protein
METAVLFLLVNNTIKPMEPYPHGQFPAKLYVLSLKSNGRIWMKFKEIMQGITETPPEKEYQITSPKRKNADEMIDDTNEQF